MGDVQPDKAEGGDTTSDDPTDDLFPDDGVQPVEGYVDPFEEDWDDAEMKQRHSEWERLLADSQEGEIASLNPGASAAPPPDKGISD